MLWLSDNNPAVQAELEKASLLEYWARLNEKIKAAKAAEAARKKGK